MLIAKIGGAGVSGKSYSAGLGWYAWRTGVLALFVWMAVLSICMGKLGCYEWISLNEMRQ